MANKKINEEILLRIEKVFEIKLYEWQKAYLLDEPILLNIITTGRCQGKTFGYIIKTIFESDELLDLRRPESLENKCDWWSLGRSPRDIRYGSYDRFFKSMFKEIYQKLIENDFIVRKVLF